MGQAADLVARFIALYSDGTPDTYGSDRFIQLFHEDALCSVAPTPEKPAGEAGGIELLSRGVAANGAVLRNRSIELLDLLEDGNRAAWTGIWSATIGVEGVPLPKGHVLRVHMAAFTEARDGRIARHREYLTAPETTGA
jgi:ketosteroid isomerase-like protein